jgi:hypothetical protein
MKANVIMEENTTWEQEQPVAEAGGSEAPLTFNTSVYKSTLMNY